MDTLKLDFEQAKARHLLFKTRLRSILFGIEIDETPVVSHYECAVGKWIYGHALKEYGHIPEMKELERVHANIHLSARELITLFRQGDVEEAHAGLAKMEMIADDLIDLLNIIEKKLKESDQKPQNYSNKEELLSINYNELLELHGTIQQLDAKIKQQANELYQAKSYTDLRLKTLFKQAPIALAIFKGSDYMVEMANDLMLSYWGRKEEEVLNKPVFEAISEVRDQGFESILDQVFKTGKSYISTESTATLWHNDKFITIHVTLNLEALREADGTISGILSLVHDISEQVESKKKIVEAEERTRIAVEAAMLGTFDVDMVFDKIISSKRFSEIFGFKETNISHEELLNVVHPEDLSIRNAAHELALTTGILSYETRLLWKDGTIHWVKVQGKMFFDKKKNPTRLIGAVMDITEQKAFMEELENKVFERTQELQYANKELKNINQELASFAYISSHDLQEPLRKIQTFGGRIFKSDYDNLSENGKDYLNRMQNSAGRMQTLIDDLLTYSRTSAVERVFYKTDLNVLFTEVKNEFKEKIEEKIAEIEISEMPEIKSIAFQIRQLFINLISNAIKFAKRNETAKIIIKSQILKGSEINIPDVLINENYIRISISDNGIGFEAHHSKKIFEVFQRLHAKGDYAGTGIGLAICKKIVDNHRGFIEANGELNNGATFNIYLPINADN